MVEQRRPTEGAYTKEEGTKKKKNCVVVKMTTELFHA